MQNSSKMNSFFQKLDTAFKKVCAEVPQYNSFDIIGTETSRWKLLVNEKGIVTIETQYTPEDMQIDYVECVRRTLLVMFSPEKAGFGTFKKAVSHTKSEGYLPVSVIKFETDSGIVTEYALVDENDDLQVKIEFENNSFYFKSAIPQTSDPAEIYLMNDPDVSKLADGTEFDFNSVVTNSITLYAKWKNTEYTKLDGDKPGAVPMMILGGIVLLAGIGFAAVSIVRGKKNADVN